MTRDDILAAEFVIGTLDAAERAEARTRIGVDAAFAARVRTWERALVPLYELVTPIAPPPALWRTISEDLDNLRLGTPAAPDKKSGRKGQGPSGAPEAATDGAPGEAGGPESSGGTQGAGSQRRRIGGALRAPLHAVQGLVRGLRPRRKGAAATRSAPSEPAVSEPPAPKRDPSGGRTRTPSPGAGASEAGGTASGGRAAGGSATARARDMVRARLHLAEERAKAEIAQRRPDTPRPTVAAPEDAATGPESSPPADPVAARPSSTRQEAKPERSRPRRSRAPDGATPDRPAALVAGERPAPPPPDGAGAVAPVAGPAGPHVEPVLDAEAPRRPVDSHAVPPVAVVAAPVPGATAPPVDGPTPPLAGDETSAVGGPRAPADGDGAAVEPSRRRLAHPALLASRRPPAAAVAVDEFAGAPDGAPDERPEQPALGSPTALAPAPAGALAGSEALSPADALSPPEVPAAVGDAADPQPSPAPEGAASKPVLRTIRPSAPVSLRGRLLWGAVAVVAVAVAAAAVDLAALWLGGPAREPRSVPLVPVYVASPPPDVRLKLDAQNGFVELRVAAPPAPPGRIYRLRLKTEGGGTHLLGTFTSSLVTVADLAPLLLGGAPGTARLSLTLDSLDDPNAPGEEIYSGRIGG